VRILLIVLISGAVGALASAAGAATKPVKPKLISQDVGGFLGSDGRQVGAYTGATNKVKTVTFLDLKTLRRSRVSAPGCVPAGGASGRVLLRCSADLGATTARIYSTASKKLSTLPSANGFVEQVGRYWGYGRADNGTPFGVAGYVNLRTGAQRSQQRTGAVLGPQLNLDDPDLAPFPFALGADERWIGSAGDLAVTQGTNSLVLRRGTKVVRRITCADVCAFPATAGRFVAWADGRTVFRLDTAGNLVQRWKFPTATGRSGSDVVLTLGTSGLLVGVLSGERVDGTKLFDLYAVRAGN
jgi:hypothetical protein